MEWHKGRSSIKTTRHSLRVWRKLLLDSCCVTFRPHDSYVTDSSRTMPPPSLPPSLCLPIDHSHPLLCLVAVYPSTNLGNSLPTCLLCYLSPMDLSACLLTLNNLSFPSYTLLTSLSTYVPTYQPSHLSIWLLICLSLPILLNAFLFTKGQNEERDVWAWYV